MDTRAQHALEDLARRAVSHDLDALAVELQELRQTVALLERQAGLSPDRLPPDERREQVAELRAQGLSTRTIAAVTGCHRTTVLADVRRLGLPTPPRTLGADGYVRSYHPPDAP